MTREKPEAEATSGGLDQEVTSLRSVNQQQEPELTRLGSYSIGEVLNDLEEAMHRHLEQPVKGDFMSLTREWRWILEGLGESK